MEERWYKRFIREKNINRESDGDSKKDLGS